MTSEALSVRVRRCLRLGFVAVMTATGGTAPADFPRPQVDAIVPPGGQRGTAFELRVVGVDLDDLDGLRFSHPGIVATPVTAAPSEFDPEPRPTAGRMRVEIAADVRPGIYEAVATGRFGVSNPRLFMVTATPEIRRTDGIGSAATAAELPVPGNASGTATAGAADHYAVALEAGQRVRISVWARRIDSRMTPALVVLDAGGRVVARSRQKQGEDPCLDFAPVSRGRYVVRVHDMFLGGGDEMPYRLLVESGPVVDAVEPPVAPPGGTSRVTLLGRGLPGGSLTGPDGLERLEVEAIVGPDAGPAMGRPAHRLLAARDVDADRAALSGGMLDATPAPLAVLVTTGDVTAEEESNDDADEPQKIELPALVAGRFHPRGDRDWLAFEADAGDEWVFDLFSRRLGMPTDASLLVESVGRTKDGKPLAKEISFADDGPVESQGGILDRPGFDPTLRFKAPADGVYRLLVRELAADSRIGIDRQWVLEARRPRPCFRLVVPLAQADRADPKKLLHAVPTLQRGGRFALDVLAVRIDGHDEEIVLESQGLPAGVTAAPAVIPASASRGVIVLTAADSAQPFTGSFRVVGRGAGDKPGGDELARVAALVRNVDNADAPVVMRESHEIPLAVTPDTAPVTVAPREQKPWPAIPNSTLNVPLEIVRHPGAKGPLTLVAAGLPAELKVPQVRFDEKATAATLAVSAGPKLAPGTYSVLLKGVSKLAFARNPQAAVRARADADRVAALAEERAAQVEAAKRGVAALDAQAEPRGTATREAALRTLAAAEAAAKSAAAERTRREEVAKAAETAAAPKDIDVPVIVPPITIVVATPAPAEEKKP